MRLAVPDGAGGWLNRYEEKGSLGDLEAFDAARRPFAMHLAPFQIGRRIGYRFPVLDLDAKEHSPEHVAEQGELLSAAAALCGIPSVPVASGPAGGVHLWMAGEELVPLELVERIGAAANACCPALDQSPLQNARMGLVRPPGSHHRRGGRAQLAGHEAADAVAILSAGAPVSAFEEFAHLLGARAAHTGRAHLVLLPGGRKRTGKGRTGATLPPSITAKGEPCRPVVQDAEGTPKLDAPLRALSAHVSTLLATRPEPARDHSAIAFAILQGLALAGFAREDAAKLARDAKRSPGLAWLRTTRTPVSRVLHEPEEFEARLARSWYLAVHSAARYRPPAPDAQDAELTARIEALGARIAAAGNRRWTRQSGPADLAVLAVLSLLILTHRRTEVIADVRSLALMTGYSRQTMNEAIDRLTRDGWVSIVHDAVGPRARVIAINETAAHTCPQEVTGHECAPGLDPENAGSDTSQNAPPPARWKADTHELRGLLSELGADLWSAPKAGHHAAWTLHALRHGALSPAELSEATGYRPRTIRRHLELLQHHQLVVQRAGRAQRTATTPTAASQHTALRGRGTGLALTYYVERHVHAWWEAETAWLSLPLAEKRRRGRRAPADQLVLPTCAATARAYPRDQHGTPDHARAWTIEARRLEAPAILTAAYDLERQGLAVDRVSLARAGTVAPLHHKITSVGPISAAA